MRPYYKPRTGYSNFKNASTFKKTSTGTFKTKPFYKKPYVKYNKHHSTNSATTAKGRYFKTV